MKLLTIIVMASVAAFAQQIPTGQRVFASPQQRAQALQHPPSEAIADQPAATVQIQLTAEQNTIIAKMLADTVKCGSDPKTHAVTCPQVYASVQDLLQNVVNSLALNLSRKYPSEALKPLDEAAKKAQQDAAAARAKALPPPKQ